MASADTSIFSFQLGDMPLDTFRVVEFNGEETISKPYSFRIRVLAHEENLSYDDAMDAVTALIVRGPGYEVKHHGVITAFSQVADRDEDDALHFSYEFLLEPRLKSMDYVSQSRIFQNQTAAEIIKAVLKEYYPEGDFWKFKADDAWPKREYTVQYNESDWAFICRLMEDEGIWYFWDHTGRQECLVLINKPDQVTPIPNTPEVHLVAESGMVNDLQEYADSISRSVRRVVSKAVMKDFNPATPDVTVAGTHVNPVVPEAHPTGEYYQYGDHLNTPDEATRKARLRAEMLSCAKEIYQGTGIFRSARAGCRVKLKNAAEEGFDGEYLLIKVTHRGDSEAGGAAADRDIQRYRCAYEGVKASLPWRPRIATPKPRIHGLLTALVEGPEDKYAYLDEEGRYHAKFFFDRSDLKDGKASRSIRLSQPYAGPNYGLHMPLHNGTEIALGFHEGDPDRPIALGAVPNPASASPVSSRNKSEAVIRTASGHQIRLDDKEDKTVIEITTKGKHVLSMNDDADAQEIRLQTTDKNELVMDDKGKNFRLTTPEGAHTLKMDYDRNVFSVDTKYGHKLTLDDEAKKIAVQTKDGHILSLDDDKKLLTLQDGKGKHVFQIDADGGLISITTTGDMELAAKGKLTLMGKEVAVEATGGAMNLKAKQDFAVDGMNVNVGAKQKVAVEAKMDAGLSGLNLKLEGKVNVDVKAGMQAKMTGVMTNVESKAINTVKGAIVMVN
ncbi:MAG TPA: type VI secretion system tip protein TssI/VgrG [Fibrobacteria bacterium]|nr:type VI secretion system tip protein TssI/VgrG [Fibrobacteria bacterium]